MRSISALVLFALAAPCVLASPSGELAKFVPADGAAGDLFGEAVAIDGNIAVVGAYGDDAPGGDSGSAYIYNVTTHQQLAKLLPSDGATGDWFGWSVAIAGNVAVVGAPKDDDFGADSGSVYLFDTTTGIQTGKLLPTDGGADDQFGHAVALVGTTVLVGAPSDDNSGVNRGSVYVFDVVSGMQVAKILPNDPSNHDWFGWSLSASASTVLVGAPFKDVLWTDSGSCYLFDIPTGNQLARLEPSGGAADDQFGYSVALDGPLALVGAFLHDGTGSNSGAAYLFNASTGAELLSLSAPDAAAGDQFGVSVALAGTIAVVGAFGDDENGSDSGSAYMIDLATGATVQKLVPSDNAVGDNFGRKVALSGTTAIIGTPRDDDNGSDSGSAYLFDVPVSSGVSFCSGNGSGAACPCGASGNANEGCLNSSGTSGASLRGHGLASIASDTFWLGITGVPGDKPGLLLRGSNQHQGGLGAPVGDGLLCTSSQIARSHVQVTTGGTTAFTDFQGSAFGSWSYGAGTHTYYQFWYRDPQNTCSGLGFNFSNAWAVLWLP